MKTYERTTNERYPYEASDGAVFENEIRAANYCQMWNAHWAALKSIESVPASLTRSEYEAACNEHGVSPLSDADCSTYNVQHGEFVPALNGDEIGGYTPEYAMSMALASRRLAGIASQPLPRPTPAPIVEIKCDCGHTVIQGQAMYASHGISCTDCYDRFS